MSRKQTYNLNRFDGGITDNIRNTTDLSKCSHVSHFDIYSDPYVLNPMPGYIPDQDTTAGGADDLQNYNIKAFDYNGTIYAVGTKSNGTGSKTFSKVSAETANWTAETGGEGTDDLADNTFAYVSSSGSVFYVTNSGGSTYLSYLQLGGGPVTDKHATLSSAVTTLQHIVEYAFDDTDYFNTGGSDIGKIVGTTVTDPAKATASVVTDIQSGDEQIGIMGYGFYPYKARLLLWDSGSSLIDQKIEFGRGRESVLGYPSGTWVGVVSDNLVSSSIFDEEANGEYSFVVKYAAQGGARTITKVNAVTNTNGALRPLRASYRDAMLFYARVPTDATPTTYKQGIWAVGRAREGSPLALSLLMNMDDLGSLEAYHNFGKHHYFAHNGDGSVSRLDTKGGAYDVNAVYESLMFGADSPNQKTLKGVSVVTEDLPSGGIVEVSYRTDEDDSWTSMGTSSTDGDERHTFTKKSDATPIGKFQEIMFKVEVTGKVRVKNIEITLVEEDNLPYDR